MSNSSHHRKKGRTGWEEYKSTIRSRTKQSVKNETKEEIQSFKNSSDIASSIWNCKSCKRACVCERIRYT